MATVRWLKIGRAPFSRAEHLIAEHGKSDVAENRESNKNIERTGVSNKPVGPEETCSNEGGASQCNPVQDSTSQHKGSAR